MMSKQIRESEMCNRVEFCEIIKRGKRTFYSLKAKGLIVPCAKDGNKYLYLKRDAEEIRKKSLVFY
jgi:hypothetical protein